MLRVTFSRAQLCFWELKPPVPLSPSTPTCKCRITWGEILWGEIGSPYTVFFRVSTLFAYCHSVSSGTNSVQHKEANSLLSVWLKSCIHYVNSFFFFHIPLQGLMKNRFLNMLNLSNRNKSFQWKHNAPLKQECCSLYECISLLDRNEIMFCFRKIYVPGKRLKQINFL